MQNNHEISQTPSVGVDDIFYLFFRHKWKIMICTLLGFAAAGYIFYLDQMVSRAQAKIFVRYITDKKDPREVSPNAPDIYALDPRDNAIMSAEAEILRSNDSITRAIKSMPGGAQKIMQAYGGGTNLFEAARLVTKNLDLELLPKSGVMVLTFTHKEQDVAQKFLTELMAEYQRQHVAIHKSGASYEEILAEADQIKKRLEDTDTELRKLKNGAHISSVEHSKNQLETQMTDLSKQIFQSDAALTEIHALIDARTKGPEDLISTNAAADGKPQPTRAQMAEGYRLVRKLTELNSLESGYLATFSENSKKVVQLRQDISEVKEKLNKLPIDPALLEQAASPAPAGPPFDFIGAKARIASLEAMQKKLTNILVSVRQEYARIDLVEDDILQLERRKKADEDRYAYYLRNLDELRIEQNPEGRSRNNIRVIQAATIIATEFKKLGKKVGGAAAGGIALGFLLAFLLDYVFNPSVKRTKDLETNLKLPVIASIPDFGRKLKRPRSLKDKNGALQKNGHAYTNGEIAPWEDNDPMLPYYEALRDRIVMSYNGDLHKPKIVGLTSCHAGAGVSRLATGLAASLSRDAERNILLVGLERNKVSVSAFAKGRPTDGIEPTADAASADKQLVVQNLHSLATTGRNLAGASVVQSFTDLMPKLKISEYDYIIFDLPPLTQTSGSLRLASQMERAILVVEAEETSKTNAKKVTNLLRASQPKLFSVLNKSESYGPKDLREDS
jgi:succinoglycan biosynthesis transport protein ExoP